MKFYEILCIDLKFNYEEQRGEDSQRYLWKRIGNCDITVSEANVILVNNVCMCVFARFCVCVCVLRVIRTREQNRELINKVTHIKKHSLKIRNTSQYIRIHFKTNQNIFTWCTKRLS